ncbi:hypothetical protein COL5a_002436 [Colletotrichum fioriniae]|uniref:Celp0028 effector like protein n=1 Tax=Colletotrichum fioriniae PJ7 TaxID=1445577 RepID=A0A010RX24_9PEZI|nr:uncharacterized protein COL516b_001849 [Colletotrichum fioriniae]EXF85146.1 hypothetical protein CFIO01_03217 [Colletotrichum fioriniae PJ7]KAJ0311145.1 hypothetical protein COL516b_001849 [Colletotrichum fioriniae]KAJ0331768.1 hypothetical protein COL5a_002436 [Colletotrichum fioriniae]KAJ3941080.1 hypothetical protein N0V96_008957 [Colletotrichum fioriniae]
MRFSVLTAAGLIGAAVAAPAPGPAPLNFDDVIVVGEDGSHTVMKASEYDALERRAALPVAPAPALGDVLSRRGCDESTEVQVLTDEEFLNWDIAVSPVVTAAGNDVAVSVDSGYSLANSVTVTAGLSTTIAKIALGVSLSVSYAKTWTTTQSQNLRFTVPDGQYGLVVSQPNVRRVTGNIFSGCTDSPSVDAFTSDTYADQSYGNLAWVKGVIRLCNSTSYPVPYCIGQGEHK